MRVQVPVTKQNSARAIAVTHREEHQDTCGLLDGELLDLYGAILIVVPVALFLKSLWM